MKNWAIIVAGGRGKRFGENKMFIPLLGKPLLSYTINAFDKCKSIDKIIVVALKEEIQKYENLMKRFRFRKVASIVPGGEERQDSVFKGLNEIERLGAKDDDIVVIHNGANPLVQEKEIMACIDAAKETGAAVAAVPVKDTIKTVDENLFAVETLDRKNLWAMQTPQAVNFSILKRAFKKASEDKFYGTDDIQLVERIKKRAKIVPCSYENFKITFPEDLLFAETILKKRVKNAI